MKTNEIVERLENAGISCEIKQIDETEIVGFSSLFQYKQNTMTFIAPERSFTEVHGQFANREIAMIIIGDKEPINAKFKNVIRVADPRKAFFAAIELCFDDGNSEEITGISSNPDIYRKNSFVSPDAVIGNDVKIGVGCVIEGNVLIDDVTEIHHHVVIPNKTSIGKHCKIHSGVIIGEYGFGYTVDALGRKTMLKHYGGVRIDDDVHIGDNSIISRGAIDDTVISRGVKINKLAIIAHNDMIGENTIITSPVHVCGSVNIGKQCHIAGVTIRNQRTVGDYSTVGLGAVVVNDIPDHTVVVGNPAKKMEK